MVRIQAEITIEGEAVAVVTHHLDRRADRGIAAHGGIQGHKRAARGLVQTGIPGHDPIQYRPSVFELTELQIRSLL